MADLSDLARERGLSVTTLLDAGIYRSEATGWWVIPYPAYVVMHKERYRNPDPKGRPKYKDNKGAAVHLYNPMLLGAGEEEVWITEGEFDCLAMIEQGVRAMAVHGVSVVKLDDEGEELSDKSRFKRSWMLLFEDTRVVVMFDNDDDGKKAGRALARGLRGEVFDQWDDEYKDANEWHAADPEGLARAIKRYRKQQGWVEQ